MLRIYIFFRGEKAIQNILFSLWVQEVLAISRTKRIYIYYNTYELHPSWVRK